MNKLNPIKYIENMLSHHPKSISLWITEGIVINGERYIIKEFRLRDGSLYAVIAENKYTPKYFEVKLAPDEETLKDIYKAIEANKIAIEKEITDRKNDITRVDNAIKANTTKIEQEITDRKSEIARVDKAIESNTAKIDKEITDRESEIERVDQAIEANTEKINQEITDRQNEITRVDNAINANTTKIDKEIQDRNNEITRVDGAISANTEKINQEITDRTNEINRVDGKLTDLEGKLTTSDGKIAELDRATKENKAKIDQEIIDRKREIERVDEATKANKAIIDQEIANRTHEINRVDGAINANTTRINQEITDRQNEITRVDNAINANTTKIDKEIQDRKNEITRVESKIPTSIGVRNLWIQSKATGGFVEETLPDNHVTGQKKCYRITNNAEIRFNIEPDFSSRLYRTVTFSAWVKYENVVQGENNWNTFNCFKHDLYLKNSSTGVTSTASYLTLGGFVGTSDWKYITYTYDYAENKSYDQLKTSIRFNLEGVQSGTAWVTGIKIELGSIPSDYTLAIEDYDSKLASVKSEIKQTTDAITTKINQEITDRQNEITRVDRAINANTAKINKEITDRTNEITRVEGKIPASVGGRNYIKNSKYRKTSIHVNDSQVQDEAFDISSDFWQNSNVYNKKIKLSFYYQPSVAYETERKFQVFFRTSPYPLIGEVTYPANTTRLIKYTLKMADGFPANFTSGQIFMRFSGSLDKGRDHTIAKVMLEISDVFSDWQPSPEDNDSKLDTVKSEIKQTIDSIKASVSSVQTTASNAQSTANTAVAKADTAQSTANSNKQTIITLNSSLAQKQDKLTVGDGLSLDGNQINIKPKSLTDLPAKDGFYNGYVIKDEVPYATISLSSDNNKYVQLAFRESVNTPGKIIGKYRFINNNIPTSWHEMLIDDTTIKELIAQKQNKLTAGKGIAIQGNVISATGDSAPQHDTQKEQVLASTRSTITIGHGANGTSETTKVDTNPAKVLEHSNLLTDYGISKNTAGNNTKLGLEYRRVSGVRFDLNNLVNGKVRADDFVNAPKSNTWYFVSAYTENMYAIQEAVTLVDSKNTTYRRTRQNGVWGSWREQVGDKSVIDTAISANTTKINQEIQDRTNINVQIMNKVTALEEKVAELQSKAYKKTNIETTDYTGYYSVYDGKVIKYDVIAKDGKYLDLRNFTFSDGKSPIKGVTFDSNSLSVIYKIYDDQYLHKFVTYDNYAKFSINDQNKIVIDPLSTSQLLRNNLDKVTEFSYVTVDPDHKYN